MSKFCALKALTESRSSCQRSKNGAPQPGERLLKARQLRPHEADDKLRNEKACRAGRLELRQGAGDREEHIKAPGYQGRRTGRKCLRSQQLAHVASAVIMRLVEFGRKKSPATRERRPGEFSSLRLAPDGAPPI